MSLSGVTGCSCDGDVHLGDVDGGGGFDGRAPATPSAHDDECGNGMDDDGDDRIDEGCPCGLGETQSCYSGTVATNLVGACQRGTQACDLEGTVEFGAWGLCEGDVLPDEERCDGSDDEDCDGAVDEGCPCREGETRGCSVPETTTPPCTGGTQSCTADGVWATCEGAVHPEPEVCDDGIDNDCDGEVDDPAFCDCDVPEPEICDDGIDNDCDGVADEVTCREPSRDAGVDASPDAGDCEWSWQPVGAPLFEEGSFSRRAPDPTVGFDASNRPVVVWTRMSDTSGDNHLRVQRFVSGAWTDVGGGIVYSYPAPYTMHDPVIEFDPSDVPSVSFYVLDGDVSRQLVRVRRLSGGGWTDVGGTVNAVSPDMTIDDSGRAYVAHVEVDGSGAIVASRVDAGAFTSLGDTGARGQLAAIESHGGVLYAASADATGARVASDAGGSWSVLGAALGSRVVPFWGVSLAVTASGRLVAAWSEEDDEVHVVQWTGSSWSALGGPRPGTAGRLAVDGERILVGYTAGMGLDLTVEEWDGSGWVSVGGDPRRAPMSQAGSFDLAVDRAGRPVVVWEQLAPRTGVYTERFECL
ncbi:MAG TPA: MopE-related protein [Sandaracinaceae bacterium LLY-WYZ-13_1]|nr:MopE-related protein [Sandaracinaceae bacterium LLY-WYZ-13_1]